MHLITGDFETFFSKDWSLKKLTTEEYIRGDMFSTLCFGYKLNDNPAICHAVMPDYTERLLKDNALLCHHAHFDGLILNYHYDVKPKFWFDTLSMARLLYPHDKSHSLETLAKKFGFGSKIVPYEKFKNKTLADLYQDSDLLEELMEGCKHDVELTYLIFKKMLPLVPKEELQVIDLTIRMFTEPVLQLDVDRVQNYMDETIDKQEELLSQLGVAKKDLASADKFSAILEKLGVSPPRKISPRTGKETFAFAKTDQSFLELLNHEDEQTRLLAEARLATKSTIGETRAGRLLSISARGDLPIYLKYYGAHTGRWSGGDKVNFQNFPRGGELRKSILAPEGYVVCVGDLSQVECRILAYHAKEDWVLEAFKDGRDLYCELATRIYVKVITKADAIERFLGKTVELGAGFGTGWKKLQATVKLKGVTLSDIQAQAAINAYRQSHPKIVRLWDVADWVLGKMCTDDNFEYNWHPLKIRGKKVILPNGAFLDYSSLKRGKEGYCLDSTKGTVKIYGAKLIENTTQATARVVISQAMLRISKRYKVALTVHDELIWVAPEKTGAEALEFGLNIMKLTPAWCEGLPLSAEGGYAVNYSK